MATPTVIQGDVHIVGALTGASITPSSSTVTDASVSASAAISASKMVHQFPWPYSQSGTSATATFTIPKMRGAGTVVAVEAGSIAAAVGAATVTIDVKKNGSSILSSVITLDNANTARVAESGTISSASYAAGDFFEYVITATAGGGTLPTGLGVVMYTTQNPNP